MDERGANIDIVFRNGLKDFEVLPPPEVWDNIHPVIKRERRPFIIIRAAALIAIMLTMSFLAYRLSREAVTGVESEVTALNTEAASPKLSPSIKKSVSIKAKGTKAVKTLPQLVEGETAENVLEQEKSIFPEIAYLQETSLSMTGIVPKHEALLTSMNSSSKNSFEINEHLPLYFPENIPVKIADRWSVGAMASPAYYSSFNSGKSEFSKQLMASEKPIVSYTGGVAFTFKINKRFSIQSGLYYSSLGQEISGINSYAGFQPYGNTKGDHNFEVITTNGTVYTNNADVFLMAEGSGGRIQTNFTNDVFDPQKATLQYINSTMHQNFSYLELPVLIRYKVVDKIIDLNLIGGVSYNLLINNSVYTVVDGGKYPIGQTQGLNPISLSSSLGMGMEYNFTDNFTINLEPTFRYYLNPFNEMTGSKNHPYSFGVFSGVSYKF